MSLLNILILTLACLFVGWMGRGRWRTILLLTSSILAIYWLQPSTPIRHLDFWLPSFTLAFTILAWSLTRPKDAPQLRDNLPYAAWIGITIFAIGLLRYLSPLCCLTPTRPPDGLQIVVFILLAAAGGLLLARSHAEKTKWLHISVWLLIGVFVILKTEYFSALASIGLRTLSGQSTALASALDIRWLGFSYVAFRLIHTLRDRIAGRLPDYTLAEFVIYIIFFPAFTAGPIDRLQRFSQDLRKPFELNQEILIKGGRRILLGLFNKFVLADSLAIIALNDVNAAQTASPGWLWILLYAYAFRIYFDFSGYTDIAIGMGMLLGIQLPENFSRPYLKPNLTQFWNNWHITLAQWFRAYLFNPVTRALRTHPRHIPMFWIILVGQVSTMLLIGLWHGITWNFAIWGLWHGTGLFVHNRWTEFIRPRLPNLEDRPWLSRAFNLAGTFLTFNYVALGWVWFALQQLGLSWQVFLRLFGIAGGE